MLSLVLLKPTIDLSFALFFALLFALLIVTAPIFASNLTVTPQNCLHPLRCFHTHILPLPLLASNSFLFFSFFFCLGERREMRHAPAARGVVGGIPSPLAVGPSRRWANNTVKTVPL